MTSLKPLSWRPDSVTPPWTYPVRRLLAAGLRGTSAVLARLAQYAAVPAVPEVKQAPEVLEFYADASAPEGALYVDGDLVGYLYGVKRL
ncbi:MAG TPA: hypothetical protein VFL64_12605 [Rhizobacter sp.]|nr:hypothetical protein [Rhizobacter sp.]